MSMTVRFNSKEFRRGVNDAMTLKPLRDTVRSIADSVAHSKAPTPKQSGNKPAGSSQNDRRPARTTR